VHVNQKRHTSDIFFGIVMMTEYPLSVVFSTCSRWLAYIPYLYGTRHCQTNSCELTQHLNKEMGDELDKGNAPVFPEVGSMTMLCPGMSFPSCSAISTIRFAILSFTEPPGETYSSFPTVTSLERCVYLACNAKQNLRRLHLRPSCLAILSRRIRGVFPTASRTDPRTGMLGK
jgi:hypothetical protein